MNNATIYIFSGLPGSGKTTLAQLLARRIGAAHWQIDTIDARYVNIEVVCSDPRKHRERVETRATTIPGLRLPTWHEVETREYHDWTVERVVLDTSRRPEGECMDELLSKLSGKTASQGLEPPGSALKRMLAGPKQV